MLLKNSSAKKKKTTPFNIEVIEENLFHIIKIGLSFDSAIPNVTSRIAQL